MQSNGYPPFYRYPNSEDVMRLSRLPYKVLACRPPNNGSTTVGVISQLIPIRTKKRNSSEMTGTTAFTATAIGFSSTMAFPVVLGVTQTRTPVSAYAGYKLRLYSSFVRDHSQQSLHWLTVS